MTTIINRNASIPVKQSEVFSTGADFQDSVEIHVLQGERPFAKDNKSLGIFKLKGIPLAPRGVPKISVTFQLDVNGLLSVSAREEKTGQEQSIKIEGASVLARDEVSKMVKEAEENAALDKAKKSFVNITYEIDNLIYKIELLLEESSFNNLKIKDSYEYLELILKEIKQSYGIGKFSQIYQKSLENLKIAYNYLLLDYFESKLNFNDFQNSSDNIIDVTGE